MSRSYYTTNKVIPWQGWLKSQVKNDILLKENSRLIGKVLVKVYFFIGKAKLQCEREDKYDNWNIYLCAVMTWEI